MNAPATLSHSERATAFIAGVRSHLVDLPKDELDDLLDGLHADLTDRLSDGGELSDPAQYAEELRQAAGLPPRDSDRASRRSISERIATLRTRAARWSSATPTRMALREFFISVRPVWWVLRALVCAWAGLLVIGHPLVNGFPLSKWSVLGTLALIVVSVQWGRGRWLPHTWIRVLRTIANVLAALLLLPFLTSVWANLGSPRVDYIVEDSAYEGLRSNGNEVSNIFAFDCEGNALTTVRLFDQDGNPLTTLAGDAEGPSDTWDESEDVHLSHDFNPLARESEEWNVFPLSIAKYSSTTGQLGKPAAAEPHRSELMPLTRDCAAPSTAEDSTAKDTAPEDATAEDTATEGATPEAGSADQAAKADDSRPASAGRP